MITPKLLKLAAYNDPILRLKTMPLSFPLNAKNLQTIADMIYSIQPEQLKTANAPWEAAVGMAANQWGINKSIFLFCPSGNTNEGLEVIINPSYEPIPSSEETEWEGCFSVPLATGNVRRFSEIHVKYQNLDGQVIEKDLAGWPARVWQHENDHLNGYLYDDHQAGKCVEKKVFDSKDAVEEFYAYVRENRQ